LHLRATIGEEKAKAGEMVRLIETEQERTNEEGISYVPPLWCQVE